MIKKLEKNKALIRMALTLAFMLMLGTTAFGQITPTPVFTSFYDSASTYNGQPLKIGAVVTAYDPDDVLCGMYVVDKAEGSYGFMSVYGDDINSPGVDEGALPGETIRFEINGRPATVVSGDVSFANQVTKQVQLSADALISMVMVTPAEDTPGSFNRTIRFEVGILNDGEGTDFYGVTATSSQAGYTTEPQADTIYAATGETVNVPFDITTPLWPGLDTVNVIEYTVFSLNDPSVSVSGTVNLFFTITDVEDDNGSGLPNAFSLYQNYPNPFNPSTTIGFSLTTASAVQLQIINVLGQAVEDRNLGYLGAGDHEVMYDASHLATGIYFYRIVTDNAVQTKKMVLTK